MVTGQNERRMGKADLHIHTAFSDGMAEIPELLDHVESQTDLDVIAIVDHDDIRGALAAREAWAKGRYRFGVVPGIEVTTIEGHLLALYIEEAVPSLRHVEEALEAIHHRGGLCIVPHPLSWLTRSLDRRAIERVMAADRAGRYFDGIETANPSPAARVGARRAAELNRRRLHLAEVGGSDAHFLKVIGSAYTEFWGRTSDDLREAIMARTTRSVLGRRPSLNEIGVSQLLLQSWRGFTATPRAVGWGPTARSFLRRIFHLR